MKHIKLFETTEAYNAATLDLPNVSLEKETMTVSYKPWVETRVVCKYNVTSTSEPTVLRTNYESNVFKSMEIDGVMLDELVTEYTFDTTGVHTVKYELYNETQLGNSAPVFSNCNLIECIIPDSVTSIGSNAFNSCSGLTSIDIPDSVTNIGDTTFSSCTGLTSIVIPDSVTNIGNGAFSNCTGLTNVTIGNGVINIGSSAFSGCSGLTNITIPDSVTSIGSSVFIGCGGLINITIGNSVTSIGHNIFDGCGNLTAITSYIMNAPSVNPGTFAGVSNGGTLYVPIGSDGYETWMDNQGNLGYYNWTKVEQ